MSQPTPPKQLANQPLEAASVGEVSGPPTQVEMGIFGLLCASLIWLFWIPLCEMVEVWESDPQYGHGFLIPVFSAYLLWTRRGSFPSSERKHRWIGILALCIGVAAGIVGTRLNFSPVSWYAIPVALWGAVTLSFGLTIGLWASQPVIFLVMMCPLPDFVGKSARTKLRSFGTQASAFTLQVFGYTAFPVGNTIELANGEPIEVEDACSGLRMLMVFVSLSIAAALISTRPIWERIVILLSSIPIALTSNILRIVATAIVYTHTSDLSIRGGIHDWAGYAMMPVGLVLLSLETWILSRLLIVEQVRPLAPTVRGSLLRG